MGKRWKRDIEARLAAIEAMTAGVDLPPALDIELPPHRPVVDHRPPELVGSWYEEDEDDWVVSPRSDPRWGFGSYI